jgi:hypothetical protein
LCGAIQKLYHKIAGKQLEVELQTKALVISILLPILSAASVILTHYVIRLEETEIEATFILQVFPYCYLDTYACTALHTLAVLNKLRAFLSPNSLTYMAGAYWFMSCEVLSHSARILAEDFQKVSSHRLTINRSFVGWPHTHHSQWHANAHIHTIIIK